MFFLRQGVGKYIVCYSVLINTKDFVGKKMLKYIIFLKTKTTLKYFEFILKLGLKFLQVYTDFKSRLDNPMA